MRQAKRKTLWCFLDGKRHCDWGGSPQPVLVLEWALAANVSLADAKRLLAAQYPDLDVTFKTC